ncbi:MAG: hybrid sensor histidine kinase/response regulator transcription factor [Flammeovirgaceae bacterium]
MNIRFLSWILGILLTFSSGFLTAQKEEIRLQKFYFEEGLSSRILNYIYQDSRGYIWVGSDDGLNRFDGIAFKVYTQKSHQLSDHRIWKILEDEDSLLWLSTTATGITRYLTSSIDIFDPILETSTPLLSWIENPEILKGQQTAEVFKSKNSLWVTTTDGHIYRYHEKRLEKLGQLPRHVFIRDIQADDTGLWVSVSKDIYYVSYIGEVQLIKSYPKKKQKRFPFLYETPTNQYIHYNIGSGGYGEQIRRSYKNGRDSLLFQLSKDYILFFVDIQQEQLGVIEKSTNEFGILSLKDNSFTGWGFPIYATHQEHGQLWDRQGGFWFVDLQHGLTRVTRTTKYFNRYLYQRSGKYNPNFAVRGITQTSAGDVMACVPTMGNVYQTTIHQTNEQQEEPLAIQGGYYLTLLSQDDTVWLTTAGGNLHSYDTQKQQLVKTYSFRKEWINDTTFTIGDINIWSIFKDQSNRIWLGHKQGISYLDTHQQSLNRYLNLNEFTSLNKAVVYHFHENKAGIWLVTTNGLYVLNPHKGIIAHYHQKGEGAFYLAQEELFHLHEDEQGYFWIATKGGGLLKWHPDTKEYQQFTTQQGLSHNVIYAVYADDYNQLWLSSNRGIMRFHKATNEVATYLKKDGITHEEFNRVSHHQAKDGTIYFGGLDGVTSFHPKDFLVDSSQLVALQPVVTDLQIQNGQSGAWQTYTADVLQKKQIVLQPSDLAFSLSFANLDFKDPKKQQYAYFIEGFDKSWTYQTNTTIRVNRLPYGDYTLKLKAQNSDGIWGNELKIRIAIVKPIYLKNWFIAGAITLLFLLIIALIRWRINRLEENKRTLQLEVQKRTLQIEKDKLTILEQKEELTKLDKLKSRFFANISHELRTPLALILGPAKHAKSSYSVLKDSEIIDSFSLIEQNAANLLQLVEELLELSKLEANQVEVRETSTHLPNLLARLFSNFESHAQYLSIVYLLNNWQGNAWIITDSNKLEKIINNLLSNALKFTSKGGTVQLTAFQNQQNKLQLEVSDTGIGIHEADLPHLFERFYQTKQFESSAQGGTGIGLALVKELVEVMGGSIAVKSQLGTGSTFMVQLPLTYAPNQNRKTAEMTKPVPPVVPAHQAKNNHGDLDHLLVVEDNVSMQAFIISLLQEDYQVISAKNGKEAQEILAAGNTQVDLIISDVMMPEMDGFALLDWIKQQDAWRVTPIIMLTARAAEADRLKAFTIGVDDYLTKPFSPSELKARVRNLLAHAYSRQEWLQEEQHSKVEAVSIPYVATDAITTEKITAEDVQWITKVAESIKHQLANPQFSLKLIAEAHYLSERQFLRRVKKITGLTPVKYRQEIQLHTGRELLENSIHQNLTELAHAVGFHTPRYFAKLYFNRFGKKPSDFFSEKSQSSRN